MAAFEFIPGSSNLSSLASWEVDDGMGGWVAASQLPDVGDTCAMRSSGSASNPSPSTGSVTCDFFDLGAQDISGGTYNCDSSHWGNSLGGSTLGSAAPDILSGVVVCIYASGRCCGNIDRHRPEHNHCQCRWELG